LCLNVRCRPNGFRKAEELDEAHRLFEVTIHPFRLSSMEYNDQRYVYVYIKRSEADRCIDVDHEPYQIDMYVI
jgi:hypothetical protein